MAYWRSSALPDPLAFYADLKAYAVSLSRDGEAAEDLVQETLVAIYAGAPLPKDPNRAKRYAFRMLRNHYIDVLRKANVRKEYSADMAYYCAEARGGQSFGAIDRLIVRDAFSRLAEGHREIIFLIDVMGFKYAEAAELLDTPAGTVMSKISRARRAMIEQLDGATVQSLGQARKKLGR